MMFGRDKLLADVLAFYPGSALPAMPRVAEVTKVTTMASCVLNGVAALSADQSSADITLLPTHSLCRLGCGPCTRPRNWPCDLRTQLRRRTKEGRASVRGYHAEYDPCALAAWRGRPVKRTLTLVSKSAFFRLSIIKRVTHMSAPQHTCGSASFRWYGQARAVCGLRSHKGTMYLRCRSVELCPSFCLTLCCKCNVWP